MGMTMRVSLPGYDALTDGTIDHYSVYADSDNVLIKEKTRGTINVNSSSQGTINHSLGYIPLAKVSVNFGGKYVSIGGSDLNSTYGAFWNLGTGNIIFHNTSGSTRTFHYYLFHDQGV